MIWNKIKKYFYIVIALISSLLFFYPLILSEKTLYFRDIQRIFYPMKYFLSHILKNGFLPFWNPFIFCGAPFMSDIQTGIFYPLSLIFVIFPYPFSFNFYLVLHVFLCFCFMYCFMKEIDVSSPAAIMAAISYTYGGYTLSSINVLNNMPAIVWLPAILWFYHRALARKSIPYYLLTTICFCFAILGGEPQLFMLTAAISYLFGIIISIKNINNMKLFIKYNFVFLTMIIGSLLVTLIQWGPTFLDYQNSVRAGGFAFKDAVDHSMSLATLKHLVVPLSLNQAFNGSQVLLGKIYPLNGTTPWLLSIYPGFIVVPLALLSFFPRPSKEIIFWMMLFCLGIIFSLGSNTPVYYLFYKLFPFFRYPEKFFFLSCISLVVLSAYGFDRLKKLMTNTALKTIFISLLLPFILFLDLYFVNIHINPTSGVGFYNYYNTSLGPIIADRSLFRVYVDEKSFDSSKPAFYSINYSQGIWQMMLMPNTGIMKNIYYVNGHTGLELKYQWIITEILDKPWTERIRLLRLANVKYIVTKEALDQQAGVKEYVERINSSLFKLKNNLPRAWIVGQIHPLTSWSVNTNMPNFDPLTSALGPIHMAKRHSSPYYKEADKIIYENSNRISIEVTADQKGALVLSESSYPGWNATVDGKSVNIVPLDYLFQGVEIDPGKHKIVFEYRPPYFTIYLVISIIAFLGLLILLIVFSIRENIDKRRKN